MRHVVLVSAVLLGVATTSAQTRTHVGESPTRQWAPPRTPDGQPDLQGTWISNAATPLERPKELEGRPLLTDKEIAELRARADRLFKTADIDSDFAGGDNFFLAALANPTRFENPNSTGGTDGMIERWFENRTSLIVDPADGKIPWTTEGRQRQAALARARLADAAAGPEDLVNDTRCLTFGVPRVGGNYGSGHYSYSQIVQAPGYVVLAMEYIHEVRIIPLDGRPHLPANLAQWNGDSRGRWDGSTLVVETSNVRSGGNLMGATDKLHFVERFTRVATDRIDYEVTLSDPATWSRPWTVMIPLKATTDPIYEASCHEGSLAVIEGILRGARAKEADADETHGRK
jgi:hypothetical protein